MASLEIRPNDESIVMAVANIYIREAGTSNDYVSLGYSGEVSFTKVRSIVTPKIGSPMVSVRSRTSEQGMTAVCQLKANMDRVIMKQAHAGIAENLNVSRVFHKDERVSINLAPESAVVIESNFTAAADVSLYDGNGVKGILGTDYTANAATGKIIALTASFKTAGAKITYNYNATADEITYGGLASCASEKPVQVKFVARTNQCRLDNQDFVQWVIEFYRAETSGDFSYAIKPDSIDPVTITFNALNDPTRAKNDRLVREYHEKVAA